MILLQFLIGWYYLLRHPKILFPVRSICILMYAPIERVHKKSGIITGVPSGRTNKEFAYDLEKNIGHIANQNKFIRVTDNEIFMDNLTLPTLRSDLMILAKE